jgi:RNA polymerase sigma-70 factor (ECF subfamily)
VAEDVAQEAWLLLHRQPRGRVCSVKSWVQLAIRHLASRERRRDRRRAEGERLAARPDRSPSVLDQVEQRSQRERPVALMDKLGEPYREVVRLRYLEEREIEGIAVLLGRSAGTVRSRLKRGLDHLRARLGVERGGRWRLPVLLPWLGRRTGEGRRGGEPFGARVALLSGTAAGVLVLGLLLAGTMPSRHRVVAWVPEGSTTAPQGGPPSGSSRRIPVRAPSADDRVSATGPAAEPWAIDSQAPCSITGAEG